MAIQLSGNNKHNLLVNHNEKIQARKEARENQNNSKQLKSGSINMNDLSGKMDTILMRKQLAKKRAMKVISDAWAGDKKIDLGIEESKAHIRELESDISENQKFVDKCNTHKEELKEQYGVADDSEEQKDLELLEKANQAKTNPNIYLSKEEEERLAEIADKPLTEYQQRCLDLDSSAGVYQKKIDDAKAEIMGENASIRAVRIERLKHHEMVDAQKEADEINAAASKEVIGMLMGEAKDYIDETRKEQQEAAKEKAEEKEEQEEKLEEQRAEKEEQLEQLELDRAENREAEEVKAEQRKNAREQADLIMEAEEHFIDPTSNTSQVQMEIKDMLQKMKLLEEDLKGAKVDNTV